MNKELFRHMQSQLKPDQEVVEELKERLETAPPARKNIRWGRYVALAACLALIVAAIPLSAGLSLANDRQPQRHSYVTMDAPYQRVVEQKNPIDGGDRESAALTGNPGQGGDVAVQPGAEAYDRLMAGMGMLAEDSQYPDWYGGAYIGSDGQLMVLLVDDKNPGDKSLELQVLGWTGEGTSFSSAKYSHAELAQLMDQLDEALPMLVDQGGWWVNVPENRIEADLVLPVSDEVLTLLARLDPEDDAIQVNAFDQPKMEFKAGEDKAVLGEAPAPGGVDGDPAGYDMTQYKTSPAERDPSKVEVRSEEPYVEEPASEDTQSAAHYDLLELPVPEPAGEPGPAPVRDADDVPHGLVEELPEQLPGGAYISDPVSPD